VGQGGKHNQYQNKRYQLDPHRKVTTLESVDLNVVKSCWQGLDLSFK